MGQQIGLGLLVGLVVSLLFWRGNQSHQVVSTFPDLFTLAVLAALLAAAIRVILSRGHYGRSASLRVGLRVAAAAGTVFGSAVVVLGLLHFSNPAPLLLAFGFFTAFGSALLCGVVAALFHPRTHREHAA